MSFTEGDLPPILTVREAAQYMRVSRSRLYELLAQGVCPSLKIGRRRMIRRADLEEYLASCEEAAL